jgi:hypothetical protein
MQDLPHGTHPWANVHADDPTHPKSLPDKAHSTGLEPVTLSSEVAFSIPEFSFQCRDG